RDRRGAGRARRCRRTPGARRRDRATSQGEGLVPLGWRVADARVFGRARGPRRGAGALVIRDLAALLRIYRDKLLLIFLILAMPWAWAFFWVPWWVHVVCILMVPVAGALLIFRVLPPPPEARRAADDPTAIPD